MTPDAGLLGRDFGGTFGLMRQKVESTIDG